MGKGSWKYRLLMFRGPGAVQGMQHKDPRRETVALEPSEDQADTSPREFCKAVNIHGSKNMLAFLLREFDNLKLGSTINNLVSTTNT